MGKVRLEFIAWLKEALDAEEISGHIILEQEIGGDETVRHLLNQLAFKYHRFGLYVFDVKSQRLTDRVCILFNGCQLELANGLETRLSDGDVLTFIPPMEGG